MITVQECSSDSCYIQSCLIIASLSCYPTLSFCLRRAQKNSKGLHSKKDLPTHRVADYSSVTMHDYSTSVCFSVVQSKVLCNGHCRPTCPAYMYDRAKNNVRTTVNFRARSGIGRSNEYMIGHFVRVKISVSACALISVHYTPLFARNGGSQFFSR